MNRLRELLFLILLFTTSVAAAEAPFLDVFDDLENDQQNLPWTNTETIIHGDAYSGSRFSRTDSLHPYGFGYKGVFPSTTFSKNLHIRFDSRIRINGANQNIWIVVSVQQGDSSIFWQSFPVAEGRKEIPGTWFLNQQEVSLPRNLSVGSNVLAVYLWNESKSVAVDIDDVHLVMEEKGMPSFLLTDVPADTDPPQSAFVKLYSGKFFAVDYDKFTGTLRILGSGGDVLMKRFLLYSSTNYPAKKNSDGEKSYATYFSFISDSLTEEGQYLNFEARSGASETRLKFLFSSQEPFFSVATSTIFNRTVLVERQSLIFDFLPGMTEVLLPSTRSDTGIFQSEYWLGHGGFIAGAAKKGFMIPSADELSSLQLDPVARRCFLNFDLNLDHPLLRFPLLRGKKSVYEDLSRSCFSPGDTLLNSFTVYTDWKKKSFPRLMKNPEGRTAALIWTEHADYTDMQTQKAIFFGSDSIQHASDAVAGFVKNRIPVTKSVFYSNPDKVMNSDKAGFVKSESASIKNTSGFRDFLVELQKEGNEICLHTPEHYTTTRSMLNEALEETEKIFHPVSWIDHGYDNAVKSNREDLACDGLDSSSRYYAADLWLKHGLKYFWNSYYEDSAVFAPYVFYSFLTVPYSGWGDRFPVPEFWEHPSRSRSLLHWRTMNTLDLPDGGLWQYCMSESKLNDLVLNRGTCIIHSYPARLDSTTGFYRREKNHFYIDPEFEKVLQRQSAFRDEGSLNLTTIRDYLDYQQAIAKVDCMPVNGNQVKIKNGSPVDLKSLSFSVKGMQLIVKGKEFKSKKQADDTIFWFDLNTGEEVLISWE